MRINYIYAPLITTLLTILLLSGCNGATPEIDVAIYLPTHRESSILELVDLQEDAIPVSTIDIRLESRRIARGTTFMPEIVLYPEYATDKSYTLISTNERIIRETHNGWVAFSSGTTELIATAASGVTRRVLVTVTVPIERIVLEASEIIVSPYQPHTLRHTILPRDATERRFRFTSSDEDVAIVSANGIVTGISEGRAVVDMACFEGNAFASINVTVVSPVEEIIITLDRARFNIGEIFEAEIKLFPEEAADGIFELSLSGRNAEILEDNNIKALSTGSFTLTATALNGVSAYIEIEIVNIESLSLELFRLSNEVRRDHGLIPFTQNEALTATAKVRVHESSILFAHQRPDGRGPFTAFTENDVEFIRAAENLAAGQTAAQQAVDGWMNSPGHRANILNDNLRQLGTAVTIGDDGRLYWIQVFTD